MFLEKKECHLFCRKQAKRPSENFSDGLFFIHLYFATTLSFKVFNTLFTVLIRVSTSSI